MLAHEVYVSENNFYVYVCIVSRFAREKIKPLVTEMDEKGQMPKHLIKELFDSGVMMTVSCIYQ